MARNVAAEEGSGGARGAGGGPRDAEGAVSGCRDVWSGEVGGGCPQRSCGGGEGTCGRGHAMLGLVSGCRDVGWDAMGEGVQVQRGTGDGVEARRWGRPPTFGATRRLQPPCTWE